MHRALQDPMPTSPDPDNQMLDSPVSQMLVARNCPEKFEPPTC